MSKRRRLDSPVGKVVATFGEEGAAAIAGVGIDAVRKWKRQRKSGGGGGLIPSRHQAAYLAAALQLGRSLTAADLIGQPY